MGRKRMMDGGELEKRIDAYFAECDACNAGLSDKDKKIKRPYSLSGLLFDLELTRAEFEEMRSKSRYAKCIRHALAKIEAFTEESALIGALSSGAAANSLKYNFGWGSAVTAEKEGTKSIHIVLDEDMMRLAE